jgi:hypothetical protein
MPVPPVHVKRPAIACVRGKWRRLAHHELCRQCWKSAVDARDARLRATAEARRVLRGRKAPELVFLPYRRTAVRPQGG